MELMFGLATVDKMQGDKEARRLYRGWTGQEAQVERRIRRAVAGALIALAAQLAPVTESAPKAGTRVTGTVRP